MHPQHRSPPVGSHWAPCATVTHAERKSARALLAFAASHRASPRALGLGCALHLCNIPRSSTGKAGLPMWAIRLKAALAGPLPLPRAGVEALPPATFATILATARSVAAVGEGSVEEG
jgi:hypothetical protein